MLHKFFIGYKDNTNRAKYKVKTKFSTFNSEVQAILYKDAKNYQNMTIS